MIVKPFFICKNFEVTLAFHFVQCKHNKIVYFLKLVYCLIRHCLHLLQLANINIVRILEITETFLPQLGSANCASFVQFDVYKYEC